jgi:hypothetical protein
MYDSQAEPREPHLDELTRDQLAEYDPAAQAVAETLDEWLNRMHGITSSHHNAGSFLEFLALRGYRVERMEPVTPLDDLLPAEADPPCTCPHPADSHNHTGCLRRIGSCDTCHCTAKRCPACGGVGERLNGCQSLSHVEVRG